MKARGGVDYGSTLSLTSAIDGWSNPRPGCFTPEKRDSVPHIQEAAFATGPARTGAGNLAYTGIRSSHRLARSESPYRLSHPDPTHVSVSTYVQVITEVLPAVNTNTDISNT